MEENKKNTTEQNQINNTVNGGSNIIGGIGGEYNININKEKEDDKLIELGEEIRQILADISENNPTDNPGENAILAGKAANKIESKPELKQKIINALAKGSSEALSKLINHPAATIFVEIVKAWYKS